MNKFLIYTSNLDIMPKDMEDVLEFAKSQPKFRISNVELNGCLANVEAGDNIITKKGNSLYVIRAFDQSLENLSEEDAAYLDLITREYGCKKVNITSVAEIIKFGTWCKSAKTLINNKTNNEKKMGNNNSIKSMSSRMKEMFMPVKANDVRIATDGNICVATNNGYVSIDANNNLTSYPEEFTLEMPVYIIRKPKEQLQAGDVIATERGYAKVTKIDGEKISAIGYTGAGKTIHTIKDALFNQTTVRVVVSMAGNIGGQINPMLLMAMSEDKKDILPFLMMQQNNGAMGMNPMMAMMLLGKDSDSKDSFKDILMMSALSGQNPFGGLFAPAAPIAAQPVAKDEEVAE